MLSHPRSNLAAVLGLLLVVLYLSWDGLSQPTIEGIDGAHHVMDGVFFRDFYVDLPFDSLGSYPFDYYAQYPALGFIFWPPVYPMVEGLFFLLAGEINLFVSQLCMLFFACMAMLAGFFLLRPRFGPGLSCLAMISLFGISEFIKYQNQVRLEVPTIAVGLCFLLSYQGLLSRAKPEYWRLCCFSLLGAIAIYTKQTAFPILLAVCLDLLLHRRQLLRQPRFLASGAALVLLLVPLALFTLKYGKSNIAQSVGSGTATIMEGYESAARFSLESWLFYPSGLWEFVNPLILLLAVLGSVLCITQREFRRANTLWLAWAACFYLAFSYFDNRTLRFTVLLYPPLVFLAAGALQWLLQLPRLAAKRTLILGCLLLASGGLALRNESRHVLAGFRDVGAVMAPLKIEAARGNLAYLGRFRQLFVYHFRKEDPRREHHFLQADDILSGQPELLEQLSKYRVQYILVESTQLEMLERLRAAPEGIRVHAEHELHSPRESLKLTIFEFTGELAPTMAAPPLKTKLL